jgi:hypothetical protein
MAEAWRVGAEQVGRECLLPVDSERVERDIRQHTGGRVNHTS